MTVTGHHATPDDHSRETRIGPAGAGGGIQQLQFAPALDVPGHQHLRSVIVGVGELEFRVVADGEGPGSGAEPVGIEGYGDQGPAGLPGIGHDVGHGGVRLAGRRGTQEAQLGRPRARVGQDLLVPHPSCDRAVGRLWAPRGPSRRRANRSSAERSRTSTSSPVVEQLLISGDCIDQDAPIDRIGIRVSDGHHQPVAGPGPGADQRHDRGRRPHGGTRSRPAAPPTPRTGHLPRWPQRWPATVRPATSGRTAPDRRRRR